MATKKENEMTPEQKKAKEDADAAAAKKAADAKKEGDPAHSDEDQDKELISSMLKKYVGEENPTDEVTEAMKQAYETAKEMGLEGEKAQEAAGLHMKMAKKAAEKKEAAKKEADDKAAKEAADNALPAGDAGAAKKMESDNKALRDEVATLKLEKAINKTISESGFEGTVLKKFKETIGTPKSEDDLKEKTRVFKEALSLASGGQFFYNPEKTVTGGEGGFSLADCVVNK